MLSQKRKDGSAQKTFSSTGGDRRDGKIDTNYGWLRVVKTRPVSYGWSDYLATTLALAVEPPKTILALMVGEGE